MDKFKTFLEKTEILTKEEIDVLEDINRESGPRSSSGFGKSGGALLPRKMMDRDSIKIANKLVKKGFVRKSITDDKQKSTGFSIEHKGVLFLRNN